METTAVAPLRSVGKVRPAGAFCRKSSPGNGGPPLEPLYGAARSGAARSVNRPVVTGVPLITTHLSYTHPAGKVGKSKPCLGPPEDLSKNQMPLFSFVSSSSVGVARMYVPDALAKSSPRAALCPTLRLAERSVTLPDRYLVSAGTVSLSPNGSIVRMIAVASLRSTPVANSPFTIMSPARSTKPPLAFTLNLPVVTGEPSMIAHPS